MTDTLLNGIVVFVLATFLGASLIGRMLVAGAGFGWLSNVFGFLAIVFAMMNVVGGYAVTDRMLEMFKKSPKGDAK
jgi:NAD/NADP transhydrogenase alpha subunit